MRAKPETRPMRLADMVLRAIVIDINKNEARFFNRGENVAGQDDAK